MLTGIRIECFSTIIGIWPLTLEGWIERKEFAKRMLKELEIETL